MSNVSDEDASEDVARVGEDVTRMLRGNCFRGIPALSEVRDRRCQWT